MPKVGTLGLDMMFRTCTVQVTYFYFYVLGAISTITLHSI
jgi:hypothetical protein